MGILEVTLLVIGILVFIASFYIADKGGNGVIQDTKETEEMIRQLVEKEMFEIRERMEGVVDETITYSMEKTERTLERLSNEKIMAVNEYSDTVLSAIHKNHEEVLFLYDMLNEKQQSLKDTAIKVQKIIKLVEDKLDSYQQDMAIVPEKKEVIREKVVPEQPQVEPETFQKLQFEKVVLPQEPERENLEPKEVLQEPVEKTIEKAIEKKEINNNDRILELHNAGKSNISIAKELGLGMGEVKLVIDLFEGTKS